MIKLNLVTAPEPRLKKLSEPIEKVDDNIRKILDTMLEVMYKENGIGLAAPQVGINKRLLVIDLQEEENVKTPPIFMANPEILWRSEEKSCASEGCLSLPNQIVEVERSESIKVQFLDYNNTTQTLEAGGLLARAIQHENDHLNGVLLIDYLTPIKRDIALRKLKKLQKVA